MDVLEHRAGYDGSELLVFTACSVILLYSHTPVLTPKSEPHMGHPCQGSSAGTKIYRLQGNRHRLRLILAAAPVGLIPAASLWSTPCKLHAVDPSPFWLAL